MQPFFNSVDTKRGPALAGAEITVKDESGVLATIYSDNGVTEIANPMTTDAQGYFEFYAANGKYRVTVSKNGIQTVSVPVCLYDPADDPASADNLADATAVNRGAGLVGFSALLDYAAGTVGKWLKDLYSSAGSASVGHMPEGEAAEATTVQAAIREVHADLYRERKYPRIARSNKGILGWHSNAGGSIGSLSDDATYGIKIEAEADFDAVALMWVNYEANAMNNCKAIVAATETFLTDSQDHRYRPFVGGTVYNALRGSSSAYGWDAVTWGGAATVNIPAAGGVSAPKVVVSDFMPINSVPRADGGSRPLLLIRAYHNGVTDGSYSYESRNFNSTYNTATAANRGRLIDTCTQVGDAIAALSTSMLVGTRSFLLTPVFRHRHNVVTVANVGDSISMGTGSTSGLDNWNRRACYDISTTLAPVVPMNMGCSSQTTATYLGFAKAILAAAKPTIAFYFPYSPNDAISTSQRKVMDVMARCADFIDFCNVNGIVPILATPVPNNNLTESEDALRRAISANVLAMGAARDVLTADFRSVTGDGATPERWIAGLNSDTLHPSDAGHEAMSTVARAAITAAMQNV